MSWQGCKNILCIRPDNMGDLIMTGPAIRALKTTFGARITVLTSSMAKGIIRHMPEIDDAIIYDLPWVKTAALPDAEGFNEVVAALKKKQFDAAVIFTVYSQNPLPTAMLAYLAGIPKILAYCRENPYHLLTDWLPDQEPYSFIKHQVRRDLDLVAAVGAFTTNPALQLQVSDTAWQPVAQKLTAAGIDVTRPWLILHPGVSEKKRAYPTTQWAEAARKLITEKGFQILITGSPAERQLTDELAGLTGAGSVSLGGMFSLHEYICLVKHTPVMLSVNTGSIHIAAAVGTPVVVLYAQTNPQHTPWGVPCRVLEFAVPVQLRSKNEVIAYVNKTHYNVPALMPAADDIIRAVDELLNSPGLPALPFPGKQNENLAIEAS
ncbi:glycosyltransferase family 9 protein [Mucilaginibacter phyllosphaerae]|uniref:Glycosyltransferase family 9 protein n=1 Tax=Mucilaginibacter phyllosphaerae TaxID=1812349 RepID=A0A4Y8AK85_9SPHI|nr:glycosyltransferase family 9 protein [Mucilaginibacter phyllosphaerae]MBB3968058.1 lipopolysaccharide heptosyltransferase II [Mucilaginibacter phyllosphaerae]TEW68919.1 glycosyltransferase family 9 protein [Mucilaginibacter phyllosphaerae]